MLALTWPPEPANAGLIKNWICPKSDMNFLDTNLQGWPPQFKNTPGTSWVWKQAKTSRNDSWITGIRNILAKYFKKLSLFDISGIVEAFAIFIQKEKINKGTSNSNEENHYNYLQFKKVVHYIKDTTVGSFLRTTIFFSLLLIKMKKK